MNELLRQAFTVLFARGFVRVAQFISFLLLARFLTPAEFGWYGLVTTAITLAALLGSLGLRQSVAYRIGRKEMTVGEGTGTVLLVWPALSIASAAGVFWLYGQDVPTLSPLEAGAAIFIGVAASMLVMLLQGVFLGRGEVKRFTATETLPRVLLTVFTIGLVLVSAVTLRSALWAQVLAFGVTIPFALRMSMKGIAGTVPRLALLPGMMGYGIAFAVNLFLITLCFRLSMFVIEHRIGTAASGQFFAAVRVHEIFLEAAAAFGLVLFSNSVRDNDSKIPTRNARIACWIFWSFSAGGFIVAMAAPFLLHVLLGPEYADATQALQILALCFGPAAGAKIVYPTIAGQGRPLFGTGAIAASLVVNAALAWVLVPVLGVAGGAVALVVGQFILYLGYALSCRYGFDIPLRHFFVPHLSDATKVLLALNTAAKKKLPVFR